MKLRTTAATLLTLFSLSILGNALNSSAIMAFQRTKQLNITFHDDGGADANWIINSMTIESHRE